MKAVHANQYAGHFGVECTLKKSPRYFYLLQLVYTVRHYVSTASYNCYKFRDDDVNPHEDLP
jgi:hypothetical protein